MPSSRRLMLSVVLLVALGQQALAQDNKYEITSEERLACEGDVRALCAAVYPDQDKIIACMKANEAQLSRGCHVVFFEGLRRRHML